MTGADLCRIRERDLRMTQVELAAALGYRRGQTVSDWECGRSPVPRLVAMTVNRLAFEATAAQRPMRSG
jgi:DNA-binding transcriptional regulator YiaG